MFWGLPETENRDRPEICDETLKRFISDELGIDSTSMTFKRAHRIPPNPGPHTKKPRPVLVIFFTITKSGNVLCRRPQNAPKRCEQNDKAWALNARRK